MTHDKTPEEIASEIVAKWRRSKESHDIFQLIAAAITHERTKVLFEYLKSQMKPVAVPEFADEEFLDICYEHFSGDIPRHNFKGLFKKVVELIKGERDDKNRG